MAPSVCFMATPSRCEEFCDNNQLMPRKQQQFFGGPNGGCAVCGIYRAGVAHESFALQRELSGEPCGLRSQR